MVEVDLVQIDRELREAKLKKIEAMPGGAEKEDALFKFNLLEEARSQTATLLRMENQARMANLEEEKEWKRTVEDNLKSLTENMQLLGNIVLKKKEGYARKTKKT